MPDWVKKARLSCVLCISNKIKLYTHIHTKGFKQKNKKLYHTKLSIIKPLCPYEVQIRYTSSRIYSEIRKAFHNNKRIKSLRRHNNSKHI